MKGIVLAGNSSNRLNALTTAIPKQLLPVYDRPMVHYPVKTLVEAGITEVMIITTSEQQPLFKKALGDGSSFGARFVYAVQDEPKGIAEALTMGKGFIDKTGVCLITGDTILVGSKVSQYIQKAAKAVATSAGATIFVYNENDDGQYGKVIRKGKGKAVVGTSADSLYRSIVGLYVFPGDAPIYTEEIEPSERGRLEITSLIQIYLEKNRLQIIPLDKDFVWLDTNTPDSLLASGLFLKKRGDAVGR